MDIPRAGRDAAAGSKRWTGLAQWSVSAQALAYAGMTSRLRDAAAIRELARAPEPRHDALRAVYAAVDDMLARDEASRTVTAGALTIKVLIEDVG